MSKYIYNESYFKEIQNEKQAYWLGFLCADGCITRFYRNEKLKSMSLELTLQSQDLDHLVNFKNDLETNVPISHKTISGKYEADKISINCTSMCRDLIKLGCTPTKSLTLEFPSENIVPSNLLRHFIRGYFDGDGGVSYTEGKAYNSQRGKTYLQHHYRCYFCGNEQFLKKLRTVLIENGINVSELKYDKRSKAINIYIYGKDNIDIFRNYIYRDNKRNLHRKYAKFFFIDNNMDLHINRQPL